MQAFGAHACCESTEILRIIVCRYVNGLYGFMIFFILSPYKNYPSRLRTPQQSNSSRQKKSSLKIYWFVTVFIYMFHSVTMECNCVNKKVWFTADILRNAIEQ